VPSVTLNFTLYGALAFVKDAATGASRATAVACALHDVVTATTVWFLSRTMLVTVMPVASKAASFSRSWTSIGLVQPSVMSKSVDGLLIRASQIGWP
jgi:hypothetical protein